MKKQKQPSSLSRLMEYAGGYKILTYLSWILSFLSALTALLPLVYIFFIIREVLEVAPDFSKATSIVHNGVMAVVFSAAALVVYIGALMCSHVSAFRIGSNIKRSLLKHMTKLPLGFSDEMGSGKIRKIINDAENETLIQQSLSRLIQNKTVMIIAHRMRTIAGADKIVVIKDGRSDEQVTPEELKRQNGFYKKMLSLQTKE